MSSRALVIGAESYAQCTAGLTGNVLPGVIVDTLHFYDWLIHDAKLKPEDIWLHLQPASGTPAQAHERALDASYQSINDSIYALRDRCGNQTERLFVFFAGHGFQFGSDLACRPEDVLVCSDFVDLRRSGNRTIRIGELLAVLSGLGPGEQYFFLDACRNLISPAALSVGNLGINLPPSPLGTPSQFVLFSTSQGVTAVAPTPFVATVVDGLRGGGQAKQWSFDESDQSADGERLLVNFQSLFNYVSATVSAKSGQQPSRQILGESPGELVVLYPPGPEPVAECKVTVSGVTADDELTVTAQLGPMVAASASAKGGSGVLSLRSALQYMVSVRGGTKYVITPARRPASMYGPVSLDFTAAPKPVSFFEEPDPDAPDAAVAEWAAGARREVSVTVRAPAIHALTEVVITGRTQGESRPMKVERRLLPAELPSPQGEPGSFTLGLLPGTYQAVLREAGKQLDMQTFSVEPTGLSTAAPEVVFAASGSEDSLGQALRAYVLAKKESEVARELDSSADRSLSVYLSLLAIEVAWSDESAPYGGALSPLVAPEAAGQSGVLLLLAGESGRPPLVEGTPSPLRTEEHPQLPGLYAAFAALPPGNYSSKLTVADAPYQMPWPVLPGRLTAVVVVARPNLPQTYNLYLLPARRARHLLGADELRDFAPYTAARLLESAEYAFARRFPLPIAQARFTDPLLLAMEAYTQLRNRNAAAASASVSTLLRLFPALPDVLALARLVSSAASAGSGAEVGAADKLPEPSALPLFRDGIQALSSEELAHLRGPAPESVSWSGPFLRFRP